MELTDLPGVGAVTAKKLTDLGIHDVLFLTTFAVPDLADVTGMDLISAENLMIKATTALRKENEIKPRFQRGGDVKKDRENVEYIETGSDSLNKLFGKGLEVDATTEVYGEFGSGKTQFSHTMCVRVQLPKDQGGLSDEDKPARVLYIDTENTFRPERITTIAEKIGIDPDEALDNIIHANAINTAELKMIVNESGKLIEEENVRLLVIDSATGLFRGEYIGRGKLSDRQGQLNRFINLVSRITERYHCATIVTNQVMKDPNGNPYADPTKPIGGDIFAHNSTYRIYFKKVGKNRIARMVDSPGHGEIEVNFALNDRGVVDVEVRDEDAEVAKKEATKKKREETKAKKAAEKEEESKIEDEQ
ncbi:DNA repair and recombination protein RadA [Nitrosopumilus sp.]|uniref:DNA repair and recombination protein RadA n=1 Tax=Nitrosopumilus sp. TaxID=2024843 RepID=UPI003D09A7E1